MFDLTIVTWSTYSAVAIAIILSGYVAACIFKADDDFTDFNDEVQDDE